MIRHRVWTPRVTVAALALAAIRSFAACTPRVRPEVVVVVNSDIDVPGQMDRLAIHVTGPTGASTGDRIVSLGTHLDAGQFALPISFGLAPLNDDPTRLVSVGIDVRLNDTTRFTYVARSTFIAGQVLRLDVFLDHACLDPAVAARCDALHQTCGRGGQCLDELIDPHTLPPLDGGIDATAESVVDGANDLVIDVTDAFDATDAADTSAAMDALDATDATDTTDASLADASDACTGLCLQQHTCAGDAGTTLSGTVRTPGTGDPVPHAIVYVPNATVLPLSSTSICDQCPTTLSGSPLVQTLTGADGRFTLQNVPDGTSIPLVIQLGKWRRQVTVPTVNPCVDNAVGSTALSTTTEIPRIAVVTGRFDAIECVLRRMGFAASEFVSGTGHIQFYVANGATAGAGTPLENILWSSPATLATYDLVIFANEGIPSPCTGALGDPGCDETAAALSNMANYVGAGGRIIALHDSYVWLYNNAPFAPSAMWLPAQANPAATGVINPASPSTKVQDFATWMNLVGATTANTFGLMSPRLDQTGLNAGATNWVSAGTTTGPSQLFTFNVPLGSPASAQCGRVTYSEFFETEGAMSGVTFPAECNGPALTPAEKALEYMIFDALTCISAD